MTYLPAVVDAQYKSGYTIHLTFSDGTEAPVDFENWLHGPVFEPLKEVANFKQFFLEAGTIGWPSGADIAPETLYERAKANTAA